MPRILLSYFCLVVHWFGLLFVPPCCLVSTFVNIDCQILGRADFLVYAAVLLLATTLTAAEASGLDGRWLTTLLGSIGYMGLMFVLHLLTRGGLGMGDVKLAAGLGLYTGFI